MIDRDRLLEVVAEALDRGRSAARDGRCATYIPELAKADPAHVAIAVNTVDGFEVEAGDTAARFTMQSVSKVFALACVLQRGNSGLWDRVQMEPSGDAFHSIVRLEEEHGRPRNPFINAGAIVVCSLLPGVDGQARVDALRGYLRRASGSGLGRFEPGRLPFRVRDRLSQPRAGQLHAAFRRARGPRQRR